jgi:hypothetical protein
MLRKRNCQPNPAENCVYPIEAPVLSISDRSTCSRDKERGRNNFRNYASQLQATFARSQIPKASK